MVMDVLERLEPGSFGKGLQAYLEQAAYSNALPADLWSSLAAAACNAPAYVALMERGGHTFTTGFCDPGDSSELLARRFQTWSDNPGYPLVTVSSGGAVGGLVLRQEPYNTEADPSIRWSIPLTIAVPSSQPDPRVPHREGVLYSLNTREKQLPPDMLPSAESGGPPPSVFMVKPTAQGVFRVDYGRAGWQEIVSMLTETLLPDPRGPADLVADAFALSYDRAGDAATALAVLRAALTHIRPRGGYALYATAARELDLLATLLQGQPSSCVADFDGVVTTLLGQHWRFGLGPVTRPDDVSAAIHCSHRSQERSTRLVLSMTATRVNFVSFCFFCFFFCRSTPMQWSARCCWILLPAQAARGHAPHFARRSTMQLLPQPPRTPTSGRRCLWSQFVATAPPGGRHQRGRGSS